MNTQNKNSHTDKTNKNYTFVQKEEDDFTTEPGDALATAGLVNRSNYFSMNI